MSDILKFDFRRRNQPPEPEPELTKEDFIPGTLKCPKPWGILDMRSNTWMGTSTCPLTFGHRIAAQIIAQTLSEQLEVPVGRHMARPFGGANVKVEDVTTNISFAEALKRACNED